MFRRAGPGWPVAGVILLLAACSSGGTTASNGDGSAGASASAPSPTPVPTAQETSRLDDAGWEMVGDTLPDGLVPTEVAISGSTIVTVATGFGFIGVPSELWSSTDGGPWIQGTARDTSGGWPQDVVAFSGGFVAVGDSGCAFGLAPAQQGCTVTAWRSSDGVTWSRISLDKPANARLTAVTIWQDALIAVGGRLTDLANPAAPAQAPVILRSADGLTWEALPSVEGMTGLLWDIATDGDQLVIVGVETSDTVAWVSTDGSTWTREVVGPAGGIPVVVSAMPGGFVATSVRAHSSRGTDSIGWVRTTRWSSLPMPDIPVVNVMGVAGGPQGAVIVGSDITYDFGERPTLLYATQDGEEWGWVPPLGPASLDSFLPYAVTWQAGRFYLSGATMPRGVASILAGMAYVPRAGEIPYSPPLPSLSPSSAASQPAVSESTGRP